jgi:hypothetical protein
LKTYKAHCRRLIKENQIETAVEKVCKPVFVRTAKEFFKAKEKKKDVAVDRSSSASVVNRSLDLSRLEDLAKPRGVDTEAGAESDTAVSRPRRDIDRSRLEKMAKPREVKAEDSNAGSGTEGEKKEKISRALDIKHLEELAKPRFSDGGGDQMESLQQTKAKPLDKTRLLELAAPRQHSAPAGDRAGSASLNDGSAGRRPRDRSRAALAGGEDENVPPPPAPFREPDLARLAALAVPRRGSNCDEEENCNCAPKKVKRRRSKRSSHRILAMVQEKREAGEQPEGAAADDEDAEGEPEAGFDTENVEAEAEKLHVSSFPIEGEAAESLGDNDAAAVASSVREQLPLAASVASLGDVTAADTDVAVVMPTANTAKAAQSPTAARSSSSMAAASSGVIGNAEATVAPSSSSAAAALSPKADGGVGSAARRLRRPLSEVRSAVTASCASDDTVTNTSSNSSKTLQKPHSESRIARRAVARRSLSLGVDASNTQAPDASSLPLDGGGGGVGTGAISYNRCPRLPVGLPKGALSAVGNGLLVAARAGHAGLQASPEAEAPAWKAVPIKMFQLGI